MVRWGDGVLIVKKARVGTWRGNQNNIWERRTEVDRQGFIKRVGTKDGLEREGISGITSMKRHVQV